MKNTIAELIDQATILCGKQTSIDIADYLISNCVFKLPCKVGTAVYCAAAGGVLPGRVIALYIDGNGGMFDIDVYTNVETTAGFQHYICKDYAFEDLGKTVFFTREEAEAALRQLGVE